MRKNKLALAIAGATTAPMVAQADAVLYGNLRNELFNSMMTGPVDPSPYRTGKSLGFDPEVTFTIANDPGVSNVESPREIWLRSVVDDMLSAPLKIVPPNV